MRDQWAQAVQIWLIIRLNENFIKFLSATGDRCAAGIYGQEMSVS